MFKAGVSMLLAPSSQQRSRWWGPMWCLPSNGLASQSVLSSPVPFRLAVLLLRLLPLRLRLEVGEVQETVVLAHHPVRLRLLRLPLLLLRLLVLDPLSFARFVICMRRTV